MRLLVYIGIFASFIFMSCSSGLFASKSVEVANDCNNHPHSECKQSDGDCQYEIDIERLQAKRKKAARNYKKNIGQPTTDIQELEDPYPVPFVAARYMGGGVGFSENERRHIKFSYYDPFDEGSDVFTVDIDSLENFYPMQGKFLSGFGRRGRSSHSGVDIKGESGRDIYAVFSGVVRMSEYYSGYGNVIVVRHDNGLETVYSHNKKNLVRSGDRVQAGQVIAECGRSGRATTEHLHFELRIKGVAYNPSNILDLHNQKLRTGRLEVFKLSNGGLKFEHYQPGDSLRSTAQGLIIAEEQKSIENHTNNSMPKGHVGGSESVKSAQNNSNSASSSEVKKHRVHTIVKGDTLSALARKYKVSVNHICVLNGIKPTTILSLGRKLKID